MQHILPSLAPQLFPDNYNRRNSPRVVLGIPIAYRFGNTIAAALTLNLSHGGIAIRTTSPLERTPRRGCDSGCPDRRRSSKRPRWSLERPPRRAWACSSKKSKPPTRRRSTSSSTVTSSSPKKLTRTKPQSLRKLEKNRTRLVL